MRPLPFLELPIMLAPIAGPGTPQLTAAACNAGAFGVHGCAYSTPDEMRQDARRIRAATQKPFGINLFVEPKLRPIGNDALRAAFEGLRPYYDALGASPPPEPPLPTVDFGAQMQAVLDIKPAVFSFTFGIPEPEMLRAARASGIYTIGTATTVAEAVALEAAGVDAVCAQGAEAGGHRGTFLSDPRASLIGTLALVPQVVDAIGLPVIAAGGISDGRGVAAALSLGAAAAQCGTAFLLASEASTSPAYRWALETAHEDDTVLTSAFSGRAARGIRNRFAIEMDKPERRAPYPYQNALTRDLRTKAAKAGNADMLSLWAGQAFRLARNEDAATIVRAMLEDAKVAIANASRAIRHRD